MSFGFSVGDFVVLTQLAWTIVQNSRKACGAHDELTKEATSLHIVLQRLQREVEKPYSIICRTDDGRLEELETIVKGCDRILKVIDQVLIKYNGMSEEKKRMTRFRLKIKFGNGEMKDINKIRQELSTYTAAITLFLNLLSIDSLGQVEDYMESHGEELRELRQSLNWIVASIQARDRHMEQSILTSYTDDDKAIWKEFRRELIKEGFSSSELRKHKSIIKDYVIELGARGMLDIPEIELAIPEADETIANVGTSSCEVVSKESEIKTGPLKLDNNSFDALNNTSLQSAQGTGSIDGSKNSVNKCQPPQTIDSFKSVKPDFLEARPTSVEASISVRSSIDGDEIAEKTKREIEPLDLHGCKAINKPQQTKVQLAKNSGPQMDVPNSTIPFLTLTRGFVAESQEENAGIQIALPKLLETPKPSTEELSISQIMSSNLPGGSIALGPENKPTKREAMATTTFEIETSRKNTKDEKAQVQAGIDKNCKESDVACVNQELLYEREFAKAEADTWVEAQSTLMEGISEPMNKAFVILSHLEWSSHIIPRVVSIEEVEDEDFKVGAHPNCEESEDSPLRDKWQETDTISSSDSLSNPEVQYWWHRPISDYSDEEDGSDSEYLMPSPDVELSNHPLVFSWDVNMLNEFGFTIPIRGPYNISWVPTEYTSTSSSLSHDSTVSSESSQLTLNNLHPATEWAYLGTAFGSHRRRRTQSTEATHPCSKESRRHSGRSKSTWLSKPKRTRLRMREIPVPVSRLSQQAPNFKARDGERRDGSLLGENVEWFSDSSSSTSIPVYSYYPPREVPSYYINANNSSVPESSSIQSGVSYIADENGRIMPTQTTSMHPDMLPRSSPGMETFESPHERLEVRYPHLVDSVGRVLVGNRRNAGPVRRVDQNETVEDISFVPRYSMGAMFNQALPGHSSSDW